MSESDIEFLRRRAREERERAKEAKRANVAAIHDELAQQYEGLIEHSELRAKQTA